MQSFIRRLKQARLARRGVGVGIVVLLIFGWIAVTVADNAGDVTRISVHQLKASLGRTDTVIIDVRKNKNWWRSSKKIPGAVREDPTAVAQWSANYGRDQTLIFYCS